MKSKHGRGKMGKPAEQLRPSHGLVQESGPRAGFQIARFSAPAPCNPALFRAIRREFILAFCLVAFWMDGFVQQGMCGFESTNSVNRPGVLSVPELVAVGQAARDLAGEDMVL
jgi:hypothetical protein